MSNQIEIKGTYYCNIKSDKQNREILTHNNITRFGARQIARFLNKDITFSNIKYQQTFGSPISYHGQSRKISIKKTKQQDVIVLEDGETIQPNIGNNIVSMLDGDRYQSCQYTITENNTDEYFEIQIFLQKPINLKKIGVLTKSNTNKLLTSYVDIKTAGYKIEFYRGTEVVAGGDYHQSYLESQNGRNVYINKEVVDDTYQERLLFYNGKRWIIKDGRPTDFSLSNSQKEDGTFQPQSDVYAYSAQTTLTPDKVSWFINYVGYDSINVNKHLQKWYQPCYRLYDPYVRQHIQGQPNSSVNISNWEDRPMLFCFSRTSDDYSSEETANCNYQCFSFESIENMEDKHGYDYTYNNDTIYHQTLGGEVQENAIIGFAPNIQAIRLRIKRKLNITFDVYCIDLYEYLPTPYNPCKLVLKDEAGEIYSYIVSDIEKNGSKVLFKYLLDYGQGNEINYKKIGLFGNMDGHINCTTPSDIEIKNENCFSCAQFQSVWSKSDDEQVQLTYQLSIEDAYSSNDSLINDSGSSDSSISSQSLQGGN